MTFVFQKIILFLALPLPGLLCLIFAGFFLSVKRNRSGKALMLLGSAALYALSLGNTADMILKPLERGYPPLHGERFVADAVVVPGGGSVDLGWMHAAPVPNAETLSRLVIGIEYAKKLRVPLILCGGNGEPFSTKLNDADVMANAAYAMGMPRNQVVVENGSRNTLENSHAVRKLVKGDRIILATSAYYMKRAHAMFAKRGFTVIPAPTFFLAQTQVPSVASFIPRAADLNRSTVGIAEWMSLAWWRVRGEL